MSARLDIPLPVRERQRRASDPDLSAWVSANAGSGKTHVLTQRVLRLLLAGAAPSGLLCLTFTKTAAANMASRVFETLASWTALDDVGLAAAIIELGAPPPDAAKLAFARRLFARAIETPGGLKIQTIHAFCERLLHLFPFEANVAAGFRVADDREAAALIAEARASAFAGDFGAADRAAELERVARDAGPDGFDALLAEALARRARLRDDRRRRRLHCGAAPGARPEAGGIERHGQSGDVDPCVAMAGVGRSARSWQRQGSGHRRLPASGVRDRR